MGWFEYFWIKKNWLAMNYTKSLTTKLIRIKSNVYFVIAHNMTHFFLFIFSRIKSHNICIICEGLDKLWPNHWQQCVPGWNHIGTSIVIFSCKLKLRSTLLCIKISHLQGYFSPQRCNKNLNRPREVWQKYFFLTLEHFN